MKEQRTLEWASAMIERQKSSGMNVQEFCKREKLNLATYYYWHQRLRKKPEAQKIIPVCIKEPEHFPVSGKEVIELIYPNGVEKN